MLTHARVELLLREGRFREALLDSPALPELARLPSIEHRLALAEAFALTNEHEFAQSIAQQVAQVGPARGYARAIMILGLVARDLGLVTDATRHFQNAQRLAKDEGNPYVSAQAAILAFRVISGHQPPNVLRARLAEVRGLITEIGDPCLVALLHESVARQDAQLGNVDEASRHLRVASTILESHPNLWLNGLCSINSFCIEFYRGDYRLAEQHLAEASRLAEASGTLKDTISNNLAHLYLQTGRFDKAELVLEPLVDCANGQVLDSALDGLARLFLATGRLPDCQRVLEGLAARSLNALPVFPVRANLLTRIRLLLRLERWVEAQAVAESAIAEAEAVADRYLHGTALFLRALATANRGERTEASRTICQASVVGAWSIRENQGLFAHVCAVLDRDGDAGRRAAKRATRIWNSHGNRGAIAEFGATNDRIEALSPEIAQPAPTVQAGTIGALAWSFDLSYSASLLGAELVDAIEGNACSPRVILERSGGTESMTPQGNECRLALGRDGDAALSLVCEIPDDPAKAIVLGDILRIGQAALALERAREEERNRAALWPADPVESQGGAIFLAEEMQELLAVARRIAPTNVPVLITGETGTGKEVLARMIHAYSKRAAANFLPFNCTSTPREMLDSQLFGHRRGAFTGATESFPGVVRSAAGGTLFLDEIGDMGLDVQPKLLRFLESNEIHPIGEARPQHVDVRVIVATNVDLDTLITEGRFREDLYYRLSIVKLHLPPLRERRVEIPTLAHHYLQKYGQEYGTSGLRIAEETMEYLVLYRWPGNVRQLANEMRRLAVMAESGAVLMPEHLAPEIAASRKTVPASQRGLAPTEVIVRLDQPLAAAVQHVEQTMLRYALQKCGGRLEETAALLGLSRKGLYLKRQRLGIAPPDDASPAPSGAGA